MFSYTRKGYSLDRMPCMNLSATRYRDGRYHVAGLQLPDSESGGLSAVKCPRAAIIHRAIPLDELRVCKSALCTRRKYYIATNIAGFGFSKRSSIKRDLDALAQSSLFSRPRLSTQALTLKDSRAFVNSERGTCTTRSHEDHICRRRRVGSGPSARLGSRARHVS